MLFKGLKKYCHFNYKLPLLSFLLLLFACENSVEKTVDSSDSANQTLENTLSDNSIGSGDTGDISDYFYDLDCEQINAKYYRYDHNAMENPQFYFDEFSDTLNFLTFPDYLTSIDSGADLEFTTRNLENTSVRHVEGEVSIETETYFNIQKFEWSEEEGRYQETFYVIDEIIYSNKLERLLFGKEIFNSPGNYANGKYGRRMIHSDYNAILHGSGVIGMFLYLFWQIALYLFFIKIKFFAKANFNDQGLFDILNVLFVNFLLAGLIIAISGGLNAVLFNSIRVVILGAVLRILYNAAKKYLENKKKQSFV